MRVRGVIRARSGGPTSLWLSWFVFPGRSKTVSTAMFFRCSSLSKGKKVELAPIYLRSLYVHLYECVVNVTRSLARYDVVSHIEFAILQMFFWERFETLHMYLLGILPQRPARPR